MSSLNVDDDAPIETRTLFELAEVHYSAERYEQAAVLFGEVVATLGQPIAGQVGEDLARMRVETGELELLTGLEAGAERKSSEQVTAEVMVARSLLGVGRSLDRLGRHDIELEAYIELAERFGDSTDEGIRRRVSRAMYNIAQTLVQLDRVEDAIEAFADVVAKFEADSDPRVRTRVSWSLWKAADLLEAAGREAEILARYRQLVDRDDERLDPELADSVAWALSEIAKAERDAGHGEEEVAVLSDLVDRFGRSPSGYARQMASHGAVMKAWGLEMRGELEEAVEALCDIAERFGDATSLPIRERVAESFARKAIALESLGRADDAIDALDGGLQFLSDSVEPELQRRKITVLISKANLLARTRALEEALVLYDAAVNAFMTSASNVRHPDTLAEVVMALMYRARSQCGVDINSSAGVQEQLIRLLGDVSDPAPVPRSAGDPMPESEIAETFAELYNGDCWIEFATSGNDEQSRHEMRTRALLLYEMTARWLTAEMDDSNALAAGVATFTRGLADGYAILSSEWFGEDRALLSLPSSLLLEAGMRQFGIDEWLQEQGHPVQFSEALGLAHEFVQSQHQLSAEKDVDLAPGFMTSIRQYEMLRVLCDSATGRIALHTPELQSFASRAINQARASAGWVWQQQEEAAGAAAARLLIAEALFVATHGTPVSSQSIFPDPDYLRETLANTETHAWADTQDLELPDWLSN